MSIVEDKQPKAVSILVEVVTIIIKQQNQEFLLNSIRFNSIINDEDDDGYIFACLYWSSTNNNTSVLPTESSRYLNILEVELTDHQLTENGESGWMMKRQYTNIKFDCVLIAITTSGVSHP